MSAAALDIPALSLAPVAAPRCLYCESTNLETRYVGVTDRLGFVAGERNFLRCRDCGSIVLDPLPNTEDLPGYYPPVYSFTRELGGASRLKRLLSRAEYHLYFHPIHRAQVRRVMRACGWRSGTGKKLLDVGCGRGLMLLEYRKLGFDVHGLDVQPDVVRHLNENLKIPTRCADVSAMNRMYEPESFDLITSYFLIEHIRDVRAAFAATFELLKPGGWVAAAVPFVDCLQAEAFGSNWINVREAPRHLSLPTRRGMETACRSAGFQHLVILPDSAMHCAGQIASSLIPDATITHAYGHGRLRPLLARAIGAGVMLASVPWCLFESRVLGRVSLGVVLARKPEGA